ncbi:D-methionine transport system permease protein [Candidatus Phytoplasma luffae]|uniref:D-methionine transport system permease protein n=1 Tax=Loofah witches'-broom phytoplasma TaxID=35773 RepID=A0A975FHR6_LOWBP|nr:ABC transporter permease subunit [Candidatus Phytoplasma luffae]QTX02583.1 D-methionine transport system permease protein [Candidatus Phytoplasma luffae]
MFNLFQIFFKVLFCKEPSFSDDFQKQDFLILNGISLTLIISFLSCLLAIFIGFPIGIYLYFLKKNNNHKTYFIINFIINFIISIPFLLLIIFLLKYFIEPYLKMYSGIKVAIICLSLVLGFIFARHCEQIFLQVNPELYNTAYTLGANKKQFIIFFLLRESLPYLVLKLNTIFVSALSYTSVLSFVGVKSIFFIAYTYGYEGNLSFHKQGFHYKNIIWVCIVILVFIVQIFNLITNFIAKKLDKS